MRLVTLLARTSALVVAVALLGAGIAAGQPDFAKALVGRWEGEISARSARTNASVVLVINSVKEDGGKWIAEGGPAPPRSGSRSTPAASSRRSAGRDRPG